MPGYMNTQSNRIEQHVGTFGQPFVSPQRLKQVVLSLTDLVIIEDKPLLPHPDVAHIMAVFLPRPEMHNHPHQLLQPLLRILLIIGLYLQLERKRNLPIQLRYPLLALIIFESTEVDGEEIGQGFDDRPFCCIHQSLTLITFEFVTT